MNKSTDLTKQLDADVFETRIKEMIAIIMREQASIDDPTDYNLFRRSVASDIVMGSKFYDFTSMYEQFAKDVDDGIETNTNIPIMPATKIVYLGYAANTMSIKDAIRWDVAVLTLNLPWDMLKDTPKGELLAGTLSMLPEGKDLLAKLGNEVQNISFSSIFYRPIPLNDSIILDPTKNGGVFMSSGEHFAFYDSSNNICNSLLHGVETDGGESLVVHSALSRINEMGKKGFGYLEGGLEKAHEFMKSRDND